MTKTPTKYTQAILEDALYMDGAAEALCAALADGDLLKAGQVLDHYCQLSYAESLEIDALVKALDTDQRFVVVPVVDMAEIIRAP